MLTESSFFGVGNIPGNFIPQKVKISDGKGNLIDNILISEMTSSNVRSITSNRLSSSTIREKIDNNKSDIKIEFGTFKKYEDIKNNVLYTNHDLANNIKSGYGPMEFIPDNERIKKSNAVYAFFKQVYYTLSIDNTAADWRLFTLSYDEIIYQNSLPVFMQTISYGRHGLITLESDTDEGILLALLKKSVNDVNSLSENEKSIIRNSTIQTYYLGSKEDWTLHQMIISELGRLDYFIRNIKDKNYVINTFNPISFELYTIKDNKKMKDIKLVDKLEYKI